MRKDKLLVILSIISPSCQSNLNSVKNTPLDIVISDLNIDSFIYEDSFKSYKYYMHKNNDLLIQNRERYPVVFKEEESIGVIRTKKEFRLDSNLYSVLIVEERYAFIYQTWKNGGSAVNYTINTNDNNNLIMKRIERDSFGTILLTDSFRYVKDTFVPDYSLEKISAWFLIR